MVIKEGNYSTSIGSLRPTSFQRSKIQTHDFQTITECWNTLQRSSQDVMWWRHAGFFSFEAKVIFPIQNFFSQPRLIFVVEMVSRSPFIATIAMKGGKNGGAFDSKADRSKKIIVSIIGFWMIVVLAFDTVHQKIVL